jgi:uncharacterized protein (TIGR02145 family)
MRKQLSNIVLAATLGLALALTFSCSSPEDSDGRGQNSSGFAMGSSPSSSSSSVATNSSSSDAAYSSSSRQSSSSALNGCTDIVFNPANKFCYDGVVYDKCDGMDYIPSSQICTGGVAILAKCNGDGYNPLTQDCCGSNAIFSKLTQFCSGTTIYDKCGGTITFTPATENCCGSNKYTLSTQFCFSTTIYDKCDGTITFTPATENCCGSNKYTLSTQFCSGTTIYSKCGSSDYNPSTQFCSGITTYDKCGGTITFTPATENCCGSNKYTFATQFCSGTTIYSKCNGSDYNPSTHYCHTDGSTYSCGSKPYNPSTQFCYNGTLKNYGSVTYNNRTYKTVEIGTQVWMAENLNYKTSTSRCYPTSGSTNSSDDNVNCDKYGRLYDWATAMSLPSSCNTNHCASQVYTKHKGICPSGWHIPSNADWDKLMRYVDGTSGTSSPYNSETAGRYLKATSGWNSCGLGDSYLYQCEDKYGFAALPGGYVTLVGVIFNVESYHGVDEHGTWWSASENPSDLNNAYNRGMLYSKDYINGTGTDTKERMISVRCLQD